MDDTLLTSVATVLLMSLLMALAASGELGELRFGVVRPLPVDPQLAVLIVVQQPVVVLMVAGVSEVCDWVGEDLRRGERHWVQHAARGQLRKVQR